MILSVSPMSQRAKVTGMPSSWPMWMVSPSAMVSRSIGSPPTKVPFVLRVSVAVHVAPSNSTSRWVRETRWSSMRICAGNSRPMVTGAPSGNTVCGAACPHVMIRAGGSFSAFIIAFNATTLRDQSAFALLLHDPRFCRGTPLARTALFAATLALGFPAVIIAAPNYDPFGNEDCVDGGGHPLDCCIDNNGEWLPGHGPGSNSSEMGVCVLAGRGRHGLTSRRYRRCGHATATAPAAHHLDPSAGQPGLEIRPTSSRRRGRSPGSRRRCRCRVRQRPCC